MSFAKIYSAQANMLGASIITVEADISRGLHSFSIVGLPDKAIEEAKDRMSAAIKNSGFESPKSKSHKVVLSLAPADIRKEGPRFDVSMALAYLLASREIIFNPEKKLFLGELSLDGTIRSVTGVLSLAREACEKGFTEIYVPLENADEAALITSIKIFGVKSLKQVIQYIDQSKNNTDKIVLTEHIASPKIIQPERLNFLDISDIQGQEYTKRALEIAAAGGHNCALYGPPGTGKTMLARAFSSLLPDLSYEKQLDVISIYSVSGLEPNIYSKRPPFRNPHHTATYSSIIGSSSSIRPGELTLAHHGVLFLDEFPEFDRRAIDALRQPLEDKTITISRSKGTYTLPARCILLVAFNPCPCGYYSSHDKPCTCMPSIRAHYQKKISGPIIDRIDLWSKVLEVKRSQLDVKNIHNETAHIIRKRVEDARNIQVERFKHHNQKITLNSEMNAKDIAIYCTYELDAKKILLHYSEQLKLSSRSHHKVLKVARTIADLKKKEKIDSESILEALQYRPQLSDGC